MIEVSQIARQELLQLIDREAIGVEAMATAAVGKPVRIATPPLASGIFAQQHLNIPPHIVRHDGKAASSEWIGRQGKLGPGVRSEEHTSELQSLIRISYAVFCLKKKRHLITQK